MARRMFSPDIVESDAFLDMPGSSQALYFHLGMYADDDGFVNPKKIMRLSNSSDDDLKVIIGKRFVLPFENGVVVIKHWRINNLIRKDWYKETVYLTQKKQLRINKNGSYTERKQFVNSSLTKPTRRLGKVRLGKDSIGKDILQTTSAEEIIPNLVNDKQKHIQIIGLYAKAKKTEFTSAEQQQSYIQRNVRAAQNLKAYEFNRIMEVMAWLVKSADFKWTLETVGKYIDEDLTKLNNKGTTFV